MTAPTRIGRYEIVRRIGRSMTDVYLAIDTVENRQAALKLIKRGADPVTQLVLEAERRGARIQQELRLLDPRVVEIYEFGDLDGYFFVAMQYVEGRNLAEVLAAERAIDATRAAAIALEICEQLAKFHALEAAVVHGDIKPSNIHLGRNDTVRLLDFGIAKTLRADASATIHNFGSPSYCSPERLTRSEVDQQSDLWAVGATLYEMLVGAPPFQADSTRKLESLIRSKRPPRALPGSCPRALRAVIMKALAPNAGGRYRSAEEFQADLQAFLERKPTVAEMEQRAGWSANATIEAARACLRRATRTLARAKRRLQIAGALAWFAMGMTLWIGGTFGWQALQARRVPPSPPAPAPPVSPAPAPPVSPAPAPPRKVPTLHEELPLMYVAAADRIFESYRASADASLHDFDWQKAEICLERAVELGRGDDRTLGSLSLARGYATLERLAGAHYSERAAAQSRYYARDQFALAAAKMPQSAEPHLALARVYVYSLANMEKAMEEFTAAERLGAALGRREIEQQADAYRIRAEQEAPAAPRRAWQDAQTARGLYRRIAGFDQVDQHLRELETEARRWMRHGPRSRLWR